MQTHRIIKKKSKNKIKSEAVGESQLSFFWKNFGFVRNLFPDFVLYGIRCYMQPQRRKRGQGDDRY